MRKLISILIYLVPLLFVFAFIRFVFGDGELLFLIFWPIQMIVFPIAAILFAIMPFIGAYMIYKSIINKEGAIGIITYTIITLVFALISFHLIPSAIETYAG